MFCVCAPISVHVIKTLIHVIFVIRSVFVCMELLSKIRANFITPPPHPPVVFPLCILRYYAAFKVRKFDVFLQN